MAVESEKKKNSLPLWLRESLNKSTERGRVVWVVELYDKLKPDSIWDDDCSTNTLHVTRKRKTQRFAYYVSRINSLQRKRRIVGVVELIKTTGVAGAGHLCCWGFLFDGDVHMYCVRSCSVIRNRIISETCSVSAFFFFCSFVRLSVYRWWWFGYGVRLLRWPWLINSAFRSSKSFFPALRSGGAGVPFLWYPSPVSSGPEYWDDQYEVLRKYQELHYIRDIGW